MVQEIHRAELLSGAPVADRIRKEVAGEVARLKSDHNIQPGLVVVRVGDDGASAVYVNSKVKSAEELGIRSEQIPLASDTTEQQLLELITKLNGRDDVDGILVQLPLPSTINSHRVLEAIDPSKDVDGFHPLNVGRLSLGQPALVPCTPVGIIELLERNAIEIRGSRACIVGRSHIVGRPLAQLLLQRDATVTICHSRTKDLPAVTRDADILIAAIGRAAFIRAEHIKQGATVIDVGINKVTDEAQVRALFGEEAENRLATVAKRGFTIVGDVHPAEARTVAGKLTPVPGGVGPLTVAILMKNTVTAAKLRRDLPLN